ncbi:DUF359 domain-containing protein [Candidatus Microgenomates bacterium]|nr:MAG: DUF359 domain-containing protein [Candidatus Microgenomates bacterium]
MKKYNLLVCGGTFDHLHIGHKEFIRFALNNGEKIIVGVTSDKYVKKIVTKGNKEAIESFQKRKKALKFFLDQEKATDRVKIIKIEDVFGETLSTDILINAITVSKRSIQGAKIINEERMRIGLPKLHVLEFPMVLAQDGEFVSSSRIREGEINQNGTLYLNPLWLSSKLILTDQLREKLKKPLGILTKGIGEYKNINVSKIITVGDVITKSFNEIKLQPRLAIIDFQNAREKKFSSIKELGFSGGEDFIEVNNPQGSLTPELFKALVLIFENLKEDQKILLKINGEEDLSLLPLLIVSPLGFIIFYGQPGEGVVRVNVSPEVKENAFLLINKFKIASFQS